MVKIAIVNYGVGNIYSITCALERAGCDPLLVSDPEKLSRVDGLVLPGVGNFAVASQRLEGMKVMLRKLGREGIPFLGICLGLQLFFPDSEESGGKGLGFIEGRVVSLPGRVKRPHMGWNTLIIERDNGLIDGVENGSFVYFAHSYYPSPRRPDIILTRTDYGSAFPSAFAKNNFYGTQFHPEKSGRIGFQILKNFIEIAKR